MLSKLLLPSSATSSTATIATMTATATATPVTAWTAPVTSVATVPAPINAKNGHFLFDDDGGACGQFDDAEDDDEKK